MIVSIASGPFRLGKRMRRTGEDLRPAQKAVMITAALIVRMLKGSSTDLR
jgi:hypothetical protein